MSLYHELSGKWGPRAQLALDTIAMRPRRQVATYCIFAMDIPLMERLTGNAPGSYRADPDRVYLAFQNLAGTCFIDQYIPDNPLTMGQDGYEQGTAKTATTGAEHVVVDDVVIDTPEAVVEHMERVAWPRLRKETEFFDAQDPDAIERFIAAENAIQSHFSPAILKGPYVTALPVVHYGRYGYENYLMAYALYPEVMEKDFAQQAELARKQNQRYAAAIVRGGMPRLLRLDHDLADSRGTLVDVKSLDRLWFPHFQRSIQPLLDAGIRLIWHCDGNLMEMVPRLIGCGITGFQGFQYEDGMDYEKICRMKGRNGEDLLIIGGVSVTRTLPMGTTQDVKNQVKWLVETGPKAGLFLGPSSSITPRTNHENIRTLLEGLAYYREHGRD